MKNVRTTTTRGRGAVWALPVRMLIIFVALALVAAACGNGDGEPDGDTTAPDTESPDADTDDDAPDDAQAGGEVTIALGSEPTTLDPQVRDDGGERAVNFNIYETLMRRDAAGELELGLATSEPEQLDDTTWQFTLREGISFHNGEPLNAEAVVYSVERIIDPDFASEQAPFVSSIVGAEAVDEHTVNILTEGPDPILPARMYWLRIVPPEHAESAGFADEPVGTGPYRFVEWRKGDQIVLEAHDEYWDGAPNIQGATFRFAEDAGTRLSGLLAGEFDVITNLSPEDVDRAPNHAAVEGLEHPMLILNTYEGPTSDVRVRQALNYAIDRDGLAEFLFQGFASPASHPWIPAAFGFHDGVEPYPYDPDRARELIAEAGAEGAEIELVGTSGRWLKDRELVETVATFWSEVGLEPNVRIFEFSEYLNRLFDRETRAPAIFVSHTNELLDADLSMTSWWHIDGRGASNQDQEVADLVDQARTETDAGARQAIYEQIMEKSHEEAWFAFLLRSQDIYGLGERLRWEPRVDFQILVRDMSVTS